MDFDILSKVVDELAPLISGARIDKVVQAGENDICLVLHRAGMKSLPLLISVDRNLSRLHLISSRPEGVPHPTGFILLLRKYLAGSRLERISLLNKDRVVEIVSSRAGSQEFLIVELLSSSPNLILLNKERKIIAPWRVVSPDAGGHRALVPGMGYVLPPARDRHPPTRHRVVPLAHEDHSSGNAAYNSSVERLYESIQTERETAALRQTLATVVARAAARAERTVKAVQGDLASAGRADLYRLYGELLLANLQRLARGQTSVVISGYDGESVTIELDPKRTAAENADAYFRRYKKAKAGRSVIEERLASLQAQVEELSRIGQDVETAGDLDELERLRTLLVKRGALMGNKARCAAPPENREQPYRTIRFEGWEILVGKTAAGNDYLSTKLADAHDLWFHAEGMPGSHVLLRNPERRDPPPAVIRKAASLAAYYSKGKGAAKVPVTWTTANYVKKPKGAKPGLVLVSRRKTVMAAPEA